MNADIIIDMRKTEATEEEYVYHELQISKSVFQTMAYGWHQYKKRDTGIDVFPSIHMLLSKRNYLPYKLLTMHNNILEESDRRIDKATKETTEYFENKNKLKRDNKRKKRFPRLLLENYNALCLLCRLL